MASVARSYRRVYVAIDRHCYRVAKPMEITIGRVPVKLILLIMASLLTAAGWVADVVPNPFTAWCYVLVVLAVVAALIVKRIEKIIYRG